MSPLEKVPYIARVGVLSLSMVLFGGIFFMLALNLPWENPETVLKL